MGYLIFSRRPSQLVRIGDRIRVMAVECRADRVRLGIDAPPEVPVHRQEVYEAIRQETEQTERYHALRLWADALGPDAGRQVAKLVAARVIEAAASQGLSRPSPRELDDVVRLVLRDADESVSRTVLLAGFAPARPSHEP